jgi:hypothetical protein
MIEPDTDTAANGKPLVVGGPARGLAETRDGVQDLVRLEVALDPGRVRHPGRAEVARQRVRRHVAGLPERRPADTVPSPRYPLTAHGPCPTAVLLKR